MAISEYWKKLLIKAGIVGLLGAIGEVLTNLIVTSTVEVTFKTLLVGVIVAILKGASQALITLQSEVQSKPIMVGVCRKNKAKKSFREILAEYM